MRYVHQPDHAMCQEYRAFLQRTGQREILIELPKNTITSPIADAYRRFGFDGLLVHCDERALPRQCSVRGAFGLPEGFPIVAIPMFLEELYFDPQERIPTLEYPIRRMAHDIVACLTASQYFSGTHSYEPFLNLTGAKINV